MNMTNLTKAHFVANARVAMLQGALSVRCVKGDLVCDIPGYRGYGTGMMALRKAADDLGVSYQFLESTPDDTKFHTTVPLDNGAQLGLTVKLPRHPDDALTTAVVTVLTLYWLAQQNKIKPSVASITTLADVFDVSFGAGQSVTAD